MPTMKTVQGKWLPGGRAGIQGDQIKPRDFKAVKTCCMLPQEWL